MADWEYLTRLNSMTHEQLRKELANIQNEMDNVLEYQKIVVQHALGQAKNNIPFEYGVLRRFVEQFSSANDNGAQKAYDSLKDLYQRHMIKTHHIKEIMKKKKREKRKSSGMNLVKIIILMIGISSLMIGLSNVRYTPVTGYFSQIPNPFTAWLYIVISILIVFVGYYYFRK